VAGCGVSWSGARSGDGGPVADGDGFDAFYLRSYGRLVAELYGVTGSLAEAEDVVQEAFARAATRWAHIREYDHPDAWVRRVALNLATSSLRRAARALRAYRRLGPPAPVPPPSPDGVVLEGALGRLRQRHREVLVLHYLADLSVEEMAGMLRIPVGTVKGRLHRARAALERELDGRPEAEVRHA
jgi:RNA polymerase sigma-70 factor (ECF subfamily)